MVNATHTTNAMLTVRGITTLASEGASNPVAAATAPGPDDTPDPDDTRIAEGSRPASAAESMGSNSSGETPVPAVAPAVRTGRYMSNATRR